MEGRVLFKLYIALSDFYLFGKVKGKLIDHFIADDDDLLTQVMAILEGIS
jgi:hypothetical protein